MVVPIQPLTDLSRFIEAQASTYANALSELRSGRKMTHWMWFVFPQIVGLGTSEMARKYAIRSLDEARAYLTHPILGARLRECTEILLNHSNRTAESILGPIDAVKLRSSMTLFECAADSPTPFPACLELYFGGERDEATLRLIVGG